MMRSKSQRSHDIAASRYGRRWAIGVFIAWLIIFELVVGRLYGWSTPATAHDTLRSAVVLLIGCAASLVVGRRAEKRYRRVRSPAAF
ncbi:hypothetical protein AB4Y42_42380 [Paraburkholderia sp. EG286B]|uniref:hypothetical protein n=1 Tax=Paraburkholderia sp. EG286B TaxID=3237011 RepID=UPI0034D2A6B7